MKRIWFPLLLLCAAPAVSQVDPDRTLYPTFLHRFAPEAKVATKAISNATTHHRPLFGKGSAHAKLLRTAARFGMLTVNPRGVSARVQFPRVEHILVILKGAGSLSYGGAGHTVRADDFLYLPSGMAFNLDDGVTGVEAVLMGFELPDKMLLIVPAAFAIPNINDVKLVPVGSYPMSTLYRLLMGDANSMRDPVALGHVMIAYS
jgi:mannose-6-phosphate isomerase-like protein (cupin superfamily)